MRTRLPGTPEPEELREAARLAAEAFDADPLGMVPDSREDAGSRGHAADWARGRHRSEKKYLLLVATGPAASRPRQPGGGRHSPRAGRVLGPAASGPPRPPPPCGKKCTASSIACKRPWASRTRSRGPGARPCWPWPTRRRGVCGRSRRGCSTTCRRSASIRGGRSRRSTSCTGSSRWAAGRSAGNCPTSAWCSCRRHLRSAQRRLSRVRISDRQRRQLADVLDGATEDAERRLARQPSSQDRRHAGRRRPPAAEPAGKGFPRETGRRTAGSDRRAGLSHPGRGPRRRFRGTSSRSPTAPVRGASSAAMPRCG